MILSIIIPCYNDYKYLPNIVKEISKLTVEHELIIVNDGSNSETQNVLNSLQDITLINHPHNLGKSKALKTGLLATKGKYIVFFDADYINVKNEYLRQLIAPVISGAYDVCLGKSDEGFPFFKWIGLTTMLTGLRCLSRQLLLDHLEIFGNRGYVRGFLIEARMNRVIFPHYRVVKANLTGLKQQYKVQKTGSFRSFCKDVDIMYQIFHYLGPRQYFAQLSFCRRLNSI